MTGPATEPRLSGESDRETSLQHDDKLELRVWLRLLTCSNMIETHVRSNLRDRFGITLPRFDVLAQLDHAAAGLTMGELSKRLMVSNGNLTGLIDRLVHEGLVSRKTVPSDRRSHLVRLTDTGRAAFTEMAAEHEAWIEALMAQVPRHNLAGLLEMLGILKESLKADEPGID